jgi:hypothetical protein
LHLHARTKDGVERGHTFGEVIAVVDVLSIAENGAFWRLTLHLALPFELGLAVHETIGLTFHLAVEPGLGVAFSLAARIALGLALGFWRRTFAARVALPVASGVARRRAASVVLGFALR